MAIRLSHTWCMKMKDKIDEYKLKGSPIKETVSHSIYKKYLVQLFVATNTPYRIINNGCGVTTITTDTKICPKCGGSGRC